MKISPEGVELIKKFEGFRDHAYKCPAGVWTIGYGFTEGVKQGDVMTRSEADKRLKSELGYRERIIEKHVASPLTQSQFDSLVSFVFNVGESAFIKSTLLKNLNNKLYSTIPAQLNRWNKVGGKENLGLTRRRQAEGVLFMKDAIESPMPQAVDAPEKPLVKSRTMANASVAGSVGIALAVAPAIEPAGQVIELAQNNTQGFLLVLGLAFVAFAAVAAFIRYSDRHKL